MGKKGDFVIAIRTKKGLEAVKKNLTYQAALRELRRLKEEQIRNQFYHRFYHRQRFVMVHKNHPNLKK